MPLDTQKPEERQFSPTQGRHPRVQLPGFRWKGETNSTKHCAEERDCKWRKTLGQVSDKLCLIKAYIPEMQKVIFLSSFSPRVKREVKLKVYWQCTRFDPALTLLQWDPNCLILEGQKIHNHTESFTYVHNLEDDNVQVIHELLNGNTAGRIEWEKH